MPYDPAADPFDKHASSQLSFGRRQSVVTPGPADFARYPKALSVWVPIGTTNATITLLASQNADGDLDTMNLPEGRTIIDWIQVRAVTAVSAGVIVRRVDD